jgi:autotransporter-associated beta strand protein
MPARSPSVPTTTWARRRPADLQWWNAAIHQQLQSLRWQADHTQCAWRHNRHSGLRNDDCSGHHGRRRAHQDRGRRLDADRQQRLCGRHHDQRRDLAARHGGTTGSIIGDVANSGVLAFNRSDANTFAGAISGTGSVSQIGTGTTILTGDSTYTGGTTISDLAARQWWDHRQHHRQRYG